MYNLYVYLCWLATVYNLPLCLCACMNNLYMCLCLLQMRAWWWAWAAACLLAGVSSGPRPASAEVYTSIQDLTAVFSLERRVVDALTTYLDDMEAKLFRIRK